MNTNGTIELLDALIDLTSITKISNPSDRNPIRSYADLFSREEPEKIKEKNVLLTVEAILNPMSVELFLQTYSDSELSIYIREVIGLRLSIEDCSIILTHAQTADKEFTMLVVAHPRIQLFTTVNDREFKTYLLELRKFKSEKKPTQVEAFSTN